VLGDRDDHELAAPCSLRDRDRGRSELHKGAGE
jgi:hypothetical protein